MEIRQYGFSDGELQGFANTIKSKIIERLAKDDMLNGDPWKIDREYQLVVAKKGWFGSLMDRVFKLQKDAATLIVMKVPADEFEKEKV